MLRSVSNESGNLCSQSRSREERLWWEGFAEKEGDLQN